MPVYRGVINSEFNTLPIGTFPEEIGIDPSDVDEKLESIVILAEDAVARMESRIESGEIRPEFVHELFGVLQAIIMIGEKGTKN